jgi:hypothetical protein
MKSNQRIRFLAVASLAIAGATFTYADDRPGSSSSTTDRPAASDTRSGTSSGTSQTGNNASDRTDRTTSGTSSNANSPDTQSVSRIIGKTVDAALSGDMRQLSQNFDQSDERRFEDANKNQAQQKNDLQKVSMELKRNFREKYQKDFSMADASQALGSDFLRSGSSSSSSDISDRARTAGIRTEGTSGTSNTNTNSTGSGTSAGTGTTGTGTTGTGTTAGSGATRTPNIGDGTTGSHGSGSSGAQRTITANSGTSGNGSPGSSDNNTGITSATASGHAGAAQSLTIPASHGLPEVRVSVVKEGNDWKLNVPDTLTPERLQSNLSRELTRANEMKAQWPTDATQAERALAHHVMLAIMDQDSQQTGGAHDRNTGSDRNSSDRNSSGSSTGTNRGTAAGGSSSGGTSGTSGGNTGNGR